MRGEIAGLDEPIAFTAHTASYPWGLPLVGALLVPLPLLTRRRKPRRPVPVARDGKRPRTMNENVAANIAWWAETRGLTPGALADALSERTGRPYTAADLPRPRRNARSTPTPWRPEHDPRNPPPALLLPSHLPVPLVRPL